ncbi:MAG: S8 family peptidase [Vulcanimicrobiota bacterium]
MVNPGGNIAPNNNISFTPRLHHTTSKHLSDPALHLNDSYSSVKNEKTQYVLIPPDEMKKVGKQGALFKDSINQLKKLNVEIDSQLPLIGGYVANLDNATKKLLEKKGYHVFVDEEKNWLPTKPWEKELSNKVNDQPCDEISGAQVLKERPKLEQARFQHPLADKYQGEGVTIAVIDSGIYPHPDFTYPQNRIVAFVDFVNGKKVPYDDNGHGTHVAGDAAGNGKMSGGLYKGPAPKANIVALKALADSGGGKTSDIIKSLAWCIQNKDRHNIKVINMSLGHTARKDFQNDPVNQAVKKAFEAGIVVVAAAGNEGPGPRTIGAPGDSPHAISVGAADDMNTPDPSDDNITDFSSRGPTPGGLIKPDLVAPGEAIIAPMSPGTEAESSSRRYTNMKETMKWFSQMPDEVLIRVPTESLKLLGLSQETINRWHSSAKQARKEIKRIFRATQKLPIEEEAYVGMPGTSMASPIVAGVVAQMIQANPDLTPGQISTILKQTADKLPGDLPKTTQGHGMIDPYEAIQTALDIKDGKTIIPEPKIDWPNSEKNRKK